MEWEAVNGFWKGVRSSAIPIPASPGAFARQREGVLSYSHGCESQRTFLLVRAEENQTVPSARYTVFGLHALPQELASRGRILMATILI